MSWGYIWLQVFTPSYTVLSDLLLALDLNDGYPYLPRLWSGMLSSWWQFTLSDNDVCWLALRLTVDSLSLSLNGNVGPKQWRHEVDFRSVFAQSFLLLSPRPPPVYHPPPPVYHLIHFYHPFPPPVYHLIHFYHTVLQHLAVRHIFCPHRHNCCISNSGLSLNS